MNTNMNMTKSMNMTLDMDMNRVTDAEKGGNEK
jgi:hypothetical protein